jgi:hypothetical protein
VQIFLQGHATSLYNYDISIATVISLWRNYCPNVRSSLFPWESLLYSNGAGNNTAATLLSTSLDYTETELGSDWLTEHWQTYWLIRKLTHWLTAPNTQSAAFRCTELSWAESCSALHWTELGQEHHRYCYRLVTLWEVSGEFSGDLGIRRQLSNIITIQTLREARRNPPQAQLPRTVLSLSFYISTLLSSLTLSKYLSSDILLSYTLILF